MEEEEEEKGAQAAAATGHADHNDGSGGGDAEGQSEVQMQMDVLSLSRKRKQSEDNASSGGGDDDNRQQDEGAEAGHFRKVIRLAAEQPEQQEQLLQPPEQEQSATTFSAPEDRRTIFYPNPERDADRFASVSMAQSRVLEPMARSAGSSLRSSASPDLPPVRVVAPRPLRTSNHIQTVPPYTEDHHLASTATREPSPEPDEEYTCPVCRELLVRPVTLDCGHTCCQHCLIQWVDTKRREHTSVSCPAGCQQIIPASIPGVNVIISSLLQQKYPSSTALRNAMTEGTVEAWRREQDARQHHQRRWGSGDGDLAPLFMVLWLPLLFLLNIFVLWGRPRYRGRIPGYARILVLALSVFQWSLVILAVAVSMTRFGKSPTASRAEIASLAVSPFNVDLLSPSSALWSDYQTFNTSHGNALSEGPLTLSVRMFANMDAETFGQLRQPVRWVKRMCNLWSSIWGARALAAANPQMFAVGNATSVPNLWDELSSPAPNALFRAAVLYEQPFLFSLHISDRDSFHSERMGFVEWYAALFKGHNPSHGSEIKSLCARHMAHGVWGAKPPDMQAEVDACASTYTWLLLWMQFEPRLALLLYLAKYVAVNAFTASRIIYLVACRIILANVLFFVRIACAIAHLFVYRRMSSIPYLGGIVMAHCTMAVTHTLCLAVFVHLVSFVVPPFLLKFPILLYLYWHLFETMVMFPITVVRWNYLSRAAQESLGHTFSAWWHDDLLTAFQSAPEMRRE